MQTNCSKNAETTEKLCFPCIYMEVKQERQVGCSHAQTEQPVVYMACHN